MWNKMNNNSPNTSDGVLQFFVIVIVDIYKREIHKVHLLSENQSSASLLDYDFKEFVH